jgi:hypothetical protein
MVDKAGGHKWLQQIGKMLEKTRMCKINKIGKWSVPSSEVTKCDTNTSPRRLVAHLLQQVESVFYITVTERAR